MTKKILLAIALTISLQAQDLKTTIQDILSTNPVIAEKLKNYNATKEDIAIANAGFYPKLDLSLGAGFEHSEKKARPVAPDADFDLSVYQTSLTLTQNLFNGYATTNQVAQQEHRTVAAAYSYIEKVNDTAYGIVSAYIQILKNQELLDTAQSNIDVNQDIFVKVQALYDSGLTTLSEVNKIESSLSLAKSNLIVQENTLLDVTYNFQKILGRGVDNTKLIEPTLEFVFPSTIKDATLYAMQNNPSILVSNNNIKLAQATYKEKKAPFYPSIDVEVSQSMNKNLGGAEGEDNRFRAMVYLKYNIFNGFADVKGLQKSISSIHQEIEIKNTLRRDIIEGLSLSWVANKKLSEQTIHLKNYQKFAKDTLELYTKEYDLGRRSLLDLLSAQNDFNGAKSQLIENRYNTLFAKYRILDAMGILVSTILEDTKPIYANVGLNSATPPNNDSLPVEFDRDKDLIVDNQDICNNSLPTQMRDTFGCSYGYGDTKRIERYEGFIAQDDNLTQEGYDNLNKLITQVKPHGWENLKFHLFGNAQNDDMNETALVKLSKVRAEQVKIKLIAEGADEENIIIHALGDKAPKYMDENSYSYHLNNRVDIAVRKLLTLEEREQIAQEDAEALRLEEQKKADAEVQEEEELDTGASDDAF